MRAISTPTRGAKSGSRGRLALGVPANAARATGASDHSAGLDALTADGDLQPWLSSDIATRSRIGSLLALQRLAGNAALTSVVAQRQPPKAARSRSRPRGPGLELRDEHLGDVVGFMQVVASRYAHTITQRDLPDSFGSTVPAIADVERRLRAAFQIAFDGGEGADR